MKERTNRWLRRAAALIGTLAAACAAQAAGTLVMGTVQAPRHLNGAVQSGFATALPSTQLFASPLRIDAQWNPQPYLAQSWKLSADGLSLTLNLRRDAVFHDGKPITSADVAFSIMAIKANHPFAPMLAPVEKVDTPDPTTAIVRLARPHPAILLAMTPPLCPILPRHVYDDGTDLKVHPRNAANVVGSGPFRLAEFKPGERIVLERFDRYFLPGRPKLDRIVIALGSDATAQTLAFERGEMQLLAPLSTPSLLKRIAALPEATLTRQGYEGIGVLNWLAFNLERKPLADVAVRKAIAMAVDKAALARIVHGGFAQVADGPIAPGSPFAVDDLVRYPFDPARAAAALDAAGYRAGAGGERFKLVIDVIPTTDDTHRNTAEFLRQALKRIGITLEVRLSPDFATWSKRMATHDFDLSLDQVYNWGDPVIGVHRTYLSTNIRPIVWTNTQSYRNPEVDKLLEAAAGQLDPTRRRAYYATFQKIVTDELPVLVLNVAPYHTAASRKVHGLPAGIWGPLSPFDETSVQ